MMLPFDKSPDPSKQHNFYKNYIGLSSPSMQDPLSPNLVFRLFSAPDSDYAGITTNVYASNLQQTAQSSEAKVVQQPALDINAEEEKAQMIEKYLLNSVVETAPAPEPQLTSMFRYSLSTIYLRAVGQVLSKPVF